MSVSSIFVLLSETGQQNYLHASMCNNVQKVYKMQSYMKSRILTDSFQCWPETIFFQMIFMFRMTRLDIVYEWTLIRKFRKWLYNFHMNPIATRRRVKSDFRIQRRNVIVLAQMTVSTEYKKM